MVAAASAHIDDRHIVDQRTSQMAHVPSALSARGLVSSIHRKKPQGRPMPERTRRANAVNSVVRSEVEHVFAYQKGVMGLVVRTIGLARARVKVGLVNRVSPMRRMVRLNSRNVSAAT